MKQKKLRKNKMQNIMGVVLILVLFIAALFMPKLYFSYYDRVNEDEVISMDAEMDTYQVQYKSMQEKLYTLGKLGQKKKICRLRFCRKIQMWRRK